MSLLSSSRLSPDLTPFSQSEYFVVRISWLKFSNKAIIPKFGTPDLAARYTYQLPFPSRQVNSMSQWAIPRVYGPHSHALIGFKPRRLRRAGVRRVPLSSSDRSWVTPSTRSYMSTQRGKERGKERGRSRSYWSDSARRPMAPLAHPTPLIPSYPSPYPLRFLL